MMSSISTEHDLTPGGIALHEIGRAYRLGCTGPDVFVTALSTLRSLARGSDLVTDRVRYEHAIEYLRDYAHTRGVNLACGARRERRVAQVSA